MKPFFQVPFPLWFDFIKLNKTKTSNLLSRTTESWWLPDYRCRERRQRLVRWCRRSEKQRLLRGPGPCRHASAGSGSGPRGACAASWPPCPRLGWPNRVCNTKRRCQGRPKIGSHSPNQRYFLPDIKKTHLN